MTSSDVNTGPPHHPQPEDGTPVSVDVPESTSSSGSTLTVIIALVANGVLAIAKSVVALLSGSASMMAEAAHSWADTGNEIFLMFAEKAGDKPRDEDHPRGYGRASYIWSLVAAFGLFSAGAVVSIWHGISELTAEPEEASYTWSYIVLAIAFVLEGISFLQASRQVHGAAKRWGLHPLRFVSRTSNPTLRAVFFEDFSALLGLVFAGAGIGLHQLTGESYWDAVGSLAIGALLAFVAIFLMRRNMEYLLGEGLTPHMRDKVLEALLGHPSIERVTYLHVEYVGPSKLFVVAAVDLTGDDAESHLAVRFREVEREIERSALIEDAVLTLAPPDDDSLVPSAQQARAGV